MFLEVIGLERELHVPYMPVGVIRMSSPKTALVVPPISSKLGSCPEVIGAGSSDPRSSRLRETCRIEDLAEPSNGENE